MLVLGLALGAGALVDALGLAAACASGCTWRPLALAGVGAAGARQPAGAHRPPPRRPGASIATRTRRRRGSRPPPRSTRGDTGARVLQLPGAGVRRLPLGLHRRPAAARADRATARHPRPPPARQPGGDGPRCTPSTTASSPATVEPAVDRPGRPAARRRHDLAHAATPPSTASARPGPELVADLFAAAVTGLGRRRGLRRRRSSTSPDIPMVDEQSAVRPARRPAGPARRAGAGRRSGRRDPGQGRRRASSPAAATALVDAAAAGLIDGTRADPLHRLARRRRHGRTPSTPPAEVIVTDSNRDRAHHWRGSQDVVGFTEDGDPRRPTCCARDVGRRAPAGVRHRRGAPADGRRPGGPGAGHGDVLRRAVRLPPRGPRRRWPSTATRRRRGVVGRPRPTRSASGSCLDVAEPIDHADAAPARAARRPSATSARVRIDRRRPRRRATVDARRRGRCARRASASSSSRRTGPRTSRSRSTPSSCPDPTIGPALAAVGFAEVDVGLGPTVEVVRPPTDVADALAAAAATRRCRSCSPGCARARPTAGGPIPSRRWSATFERARRPAVRRRRHRAPRPAGRRRRPGRAARHHRARRPRPGSPASRRPPAGRSPTTTRRRRGSRRSAAPSAPTLDRADARAGRRARR